MRENMIDSISSVKDKKLKTSQYSILAEVKRDHPT
jgi:hypothetical protein